MSISGSSSITVAAAEPGGLKRIVLPSGLALHVVSRIDAELELHANEKHQVYFGSGLVRLQQGDTVIDVGANIGSFARVAAQAVGPAGLVVCLEPLPLLHQALKLNLASFDTWAGQHGVKVARTVALQIGLGAAADPAAEFVFYPSCTALSTQYPDVPDVLQATISLVAYSPQSTSWLQRIGRQVARMFPRLYWVLHSLLFPALYLRGAQLVTAPVRTLSQIINEQNLQRIDLLKINVERAELDVLMGLSVEHWQRMRQVAVQVHDMDDRVQAVRQLLHCAGFQKVQVYKEPRFQGCNLFMVYATREMGPERAPPVKCNTR